MVRPDKKTLDNQNQLIFSLFETRFENHSNYDLAMIRIGLFKQNNWYGSLLEIHRSTKDGKKEITYFDIFYLRYLKTNKDLQSRLSDFFDFSSVKASVLTVWNMLDKSFYFLVKNPMWSTLNGLLKRITPDTKGDVRRHAQ